MQTIATEDASSLLQDWIKSEYVELAQEAGRTLRRLKLRREVTGATLTQLGSDYQKSQPLAPVRRRG